MQTFANIFFPKKVIKQANLFAKVGLEKSQLSSYATPGMLHEPKRL